MLFTTVNIILFFIFSLPAAQAENTGIARTIHVLDVSHVIILPIVSDSSGPKKPADMAKSLCEGCFEIGEHIEQQDHQHIDTMFIAKFLLQDVSRNARHVFFHKKGEYEEILNTLKPWQWKGHVSH